MPALIQTQLDLAGSVVGKAVGEGVVEGALVGGIEGTASQRTAMLKLDSRAVETREDRVGSIYQI